jgi:pantetheine-phosphate adenylyltransferase
VYAGTFDPVTLGHLHIIRRAAKLFESLTVAVAESTGKRTVFTAEERARLVREEVSDLPNVSVVIFEGLLSDLVKRDGFDVLVRGIRGVDTVFLQTEPSLQFVASSYVKEIASLGGDVGAFVSPRVAEALKQKIPGFKP